MEVSVLNLDTANIENIEIDKNEVVELIKNTSCCRVYDKIFPMCCKTKDKIYIFALDSYSRKIIGLAGGLTYILDEICSFLEGKHLEAHTLDSLITCHSHAIASNYDIKFVNSSNEKCLLYSEVNGEYGLSVCDIDGDVIKAIKKYKMNTILINTNINLGPEEYVKYVFNFNIVKDSIEDFDIDKLDNVVNIHNSFKNKIRYLEEFNNVKYLGGNELNSLNFDFTQVASDMEPRTVYDGGYVIIKNSILCNSISGIGMNTQKMASGIALTSFMQRFIMIFKYKGVLPAISAINQYGLFGFYPILYLHPELDMYGSKDNILSLIDVAYLVDAEDIYDTEVEALDVWKYFVPYLMAENWKDYKDVVAEEKMRILGYDNTEHKDQIVTNKDFLEFCITNKCVGTPRQFSYASRNEQYSEVLLKPGKTPDEYYRMGDGCRCSFYIYEEDGDLYFRDCIRLETYAVDKLDPESNYYYVRLVEICKNNNLIFKKVFADRYVCVCGEYVLDMQQSGVLRVTRGDNLPSADPNLVSEDTWEFEQEKRIDPNTRSDAFYQFKYYDDCGVPKEVIKALYRHKYLDGFVNPTSREIEIYGDRRNPNGNDIVEFIKNNPGKECTIEKTSRVYKDLRNITDIYKGTFFGYWIDLYSRGGDNTSNITREPDWDRIIWYCNFGNEFATVELPDLISEDLGMRRYKIKLHHKHDCDYYTVVQEYFGLGCVNLIRCSNIEWRLSTGCYGSDYFDVAYPEEQEKARSVVTGYKNFAKFVLKFKTSEMVLRTKECLIISKVNHNYFIVGGFRMGNVMQNELTDYVSEHVINCMKNTKNPSYLNSVMTFLIDRYRWRCVSLSNVDKGLFALVNTRIAQELSESVDSILNDVDLSMYEKVYCYVGNIIYNFKYDGDDSMISCIQEVDDSKIIVDGLEYYWSVNLGLFATKNQGGKEVVEETEDIGKNSYGVTEETKINLESNTKLGSGYLENMKNANKKIDEMYAGWDNSNGASIEVNNEDEVDNDMSSTNYFN